MARAKKVAVAKAGFSLDISGIDHLLTLAKQRQIAAKAVKKGAKLIQSAAKAGAPRRKRSGTLRRSIGVKAVKGKGTSAYAAVGARRKVEKMVSVGKRGRKVKTVPSKYAHLVEYGTRPHTLGKDSKLTRKDGSGEEKQHGKRHPGAKAKPFLRPAFEATKDRAIEVAKEAMAEGVKEALAKAKGKIFKNMVGG